MSSSSNTEEACAERVLLTLLHVQGEITKDPIYIDAERRFDELETETKKLHEESQR